MPGQPLTDRPATPPSDPGHDLTIVLLTVAGVALGAFALVAYGLLRLAGWFAR